MPGEPAAALLSAEQALELQQSSSSVRTTRTWESSSVARGWPTVARRRLSSRCARPTDSGSASDPQSVWAAEAEYWFGQAYIANGEAKRGRWMVAEARQELAKSPVASHRALAREP